MWISRKKYEELIKRALITADEKDLIRVLRNTLVEKHHFNMELNKWCMDRRIENIETDKHIKELEAQLAEKEDSKFPFVVIHCTAESKWDDVVKDPKNKNKTTTEKEYLKNNYWVLSKKDKDFIDKFHSVVLNCTAESEKEQPKEKEVEVKPYYFERLPSPKEFIVTETCDIMGRGINIGSMSCRQCINCITNNGDGFIKCKLKPEGKAKKESKQPEVIRYDGYGEISEVSKDFIGCSCELCVYKYKRSRLKACRHCDKNLTSNEYYSSK